MRLFPSVLAAALAIPFAPGAARAEPDARALYLENCASCHGEDGKADTELGRKNMAQDFTAADFAKEVTIPMARKVIASGVRKTKMKAFKDILKPAEIEALAGYVVAFSRKD